MSNAHSACHTDDRRDQSDFVYCMLCNLKSAYNGRVITPPTVLCTRYSNSTCPGDFSEIHTIKIIFFLAKRTARWRKHNKKYGNRFLMEAGNARQCVWCIRCVQIFVYCYAWCLSILVFRRCREQY